MRSRPACFNAVAWRASVEPLVVSWGYEAEMPSGSRFIDEQEWTGTRDPAAWLCVSIQAYNSRADVERLVEGLEKLLGRG